MAASAISLSLSFSKYPLKTLPLPFPSRLRPTTTTPLLRRPLLNLNQSRPAPIIRAHLDDVDDSVINPRPAVELGKSLLWAVLWASVSVFAFAFAGGREAKAAAAVADSSIKASGFGVRIAGALRGSGWPDAAVVFALATLPVIELRGLFRSGTGCGSTL